MRRTEAQARRDGQKIHKILGSDWTLRVFENLGWHWSAYVGLAHDINFSRPSGGRKAEQLMLIVNWEGPSITLRGDSPKAMLRMARRKMAEYGSSVVQALAQFPG